MNVTKYDTLKDNEGQTWRVMDVEGEELKIKKVTGDGKNAPGKARTISIAEVGEQYRLLDLPKVTVTQTKPAPNLNLEEQVKEIFASGDPDAIDDLILAEPEEVEALREENEKFLAQTQDLQAANIVLTNDVKNLREENEKLRKTIKELRVINDNWASGEPVEALKGRNEMLKDEKQKFEREVLACEADLEMARDDLEIARTDIKAMEDLAASLRMEINQLKQEHESEVAELNDEIMELKIIAKKKNEYADELDENRLAFERINTLVKSIIGMTASIGDLADMAKDETEWRI